MDIRVNSKLLLDERLINNWEDMLDAYRKRIAEHGLKHKALFYPNEELHTIKLAHISRIINILIMPEDSVLDVGCGMGDITIFMPPCNYKGIDIVSEFIEEAQKRYPGLRFECGNLMDVNEKFDWVILLGMMGTVPMPEQLLQKSWGLATKGLIVDFIDTQKYQGYLNSYDLGNCTNFFLSLGAQQIHLYPTPRTNWTFYVVQKRSIWLNAVTESA